VALIIFRLSLACTIFLSVVLPNSMRITAATALVVCAFSSIFVMNKSRRLLEILFLYGLTLFVTFFYVLVGIIKGAPSVAAFQVITVYTISPILWISVAAGIDSRIGYETFSKWISFLTCSAAASVALFFYLFINYGPESVLFFIETANVNLNDGYVGATMSVYGSFIFLTGALFAVPTIIKSLFLRIFCLLCILIVAVTSGRSALILSMFVGASIFLILRRADNEDRKRTKGGLAILLIVAVGILGYIYISSVDLGLIFQLFYDEVVSGGGEERVQQAISLIRGTVDTWALGAGHGIGVDYIRSEDYPWRYELVWLANLYRVGAVGFLIYFLPVFFYFARFFWFYRKESLSKVDVFMFGGFFCALIASNTNPYAEAFAFQWMYVIPFVFLMLKKKIVD
jgi:hypothetical protein